METDDSFKTNLNSVKEMILDEEKLVTYVSLSKELCVHVNLSKKLLHSVVDKIHKEHPNVQLNVSYILSGLSSNTAAVTTVCTEKDLDKLKEEYKIVFFCHIYSVSKGPSCVDSTAFLLLSKFEDYNLCTGIIKSNECHKRSLDEIGNLKINSQEAMLRESKSFETINKKVEHQDSSAPQASKNKETNEEKKIFEPNIKTEVASPKKETSINKSTTTKANGSKSQKGIALFFNKANGKQNKKVSKEIVRERTPENIPQVKEEKMDTDDIKSENVKDIKNNQSCDENKVPKIESKPSKNSSTLKQIKKTAKVDKKRKRVLQISDSDSDEENDPFADKQEINRESDDEIPPTPSADNNIKITSGIVNPKKRRKIVDKTYTDEDGYILTKKEEVYESCSEHEEEIQNVKVTKLEQKVKTETSPKDKKTSPKKSKKKISPPQIGKQQTLNNFFKRK